MAALKELLLPFLEQATEARDPEELDAIAEEYLADVRTYLTQEHGIDVTEL